MTQIVITQVRNAQSMNIANTSIDVEINHPVYGWIPYLLTDHDDDTTIDNDAVMALIGSDFVAHVPPTQSEIDIEEQHSLNFINSDYLTETDWYVIRNQETGIDIPQDILTARAEARASIV